MAYKTIIGLEIHTELLLDSKLFCSCKNEFGNEPNTAVCPNCLGLPGAMATLNKKAVELAMNAGMAFDCDINTKSKIDRKHYFYIDMGKGYQISQDEYPICQGGYIDIELDGKTKRINLERIHLEEDAGKLTHTEDNETLVDYNRAGVALIEIVTKPDLNSAKETRAFIEELRARLKYIGVSDVRMEEGSLRVDVNVNIVNEETGVKSNISELKNLNSIRGIEKAIEYEEERHKKLLEAGENTVNETRGWNDAKEETFFMREKGEETDYRYLADGNLSYIEIEDDWIDEVRNLLPELPRDKRDRFIKEYELSKYDAEVLTESNALADYFEDTAKIVKDYNMLSNWIMGDVLRRLNDLEIDITQAPLTSEYLAEIIEMVKSDKISNNAGKKVLREVFETGDEPKAIVKREGLEQVSDSNIIEELIQKVLDENEQSIIDYKEGKDRALGYLVGQVMRHSKGQANPQMVSERLKEILD